MNAQPLDYAGADALLRRARDRIKDAEEELEKRLTEKAEAERDYRKQLSEAYLRRKSEGRGSGEAELLSKGDVTELSFRRDLADGLVKAALEALENRRGDRASLHRLVEWSSKVNPDAEQREPLRSAA